MDCVDNNFRKENKCPYCGYLVDRAVAVERPQEVPTPGCLSVCIKCSAVSELDSHMDLIKFDMNRLELEDARYIHKIQVLIKQIHDAKNKINGDKK